MRFKNEGEQTRFLHENAAWFRLFCMSDYDMWEAIS